MILYVDNVTVYMLPEGKYCIALHRCINLLRYVIAFLFYKICVLSHSSKGQRNAI
jgi:hypothetical protein